MRPRSRPGLTAAIAACAPAVVHQLPDLWSVVFGVQGKTEPRVHSLGLPRLLSAALSHQVRKHGGRDVRAAPDGHSSMAARQYVGPHAHYAF